jgi:cysteine desulfurase
MVAALRGSYDASAILRLRRTIEDFAIGKGALVVGAGAARLPNTVCLAYPDIRADTQLIGLDLRGVAVSAGSACSSGKLAASHVLEAMGLGKLAGQAIRVSLPWNVAAADVAGFTQAYEIVIQRALHGAGRAFTEAAV